MNNISLRMWTVLAIVLLPCVWGCGPQSNQPVSSNGTAKFADPDSRPPSELAIPTREELRAKAEKPKVTFDTPPPLAELEANVEWIDQPVQDGMELLRAHQEKEKPLVSVREALSLRNTSAEANAKITSALGRLPANEKEVNWDATLVRTSAGEIKSTNPILISSSSEFDFQDLTGVGLFGFDWTMRAFAIKDTVVCWQSSKDRLYDKIVLRSDLTWSDGQPITAHDVEFSYKTILDERINVPAVRSGTDKIKWVKAYDDHTVVYAHKEPYVTNQENISFPILPKHVYEASLKDDPTMVESEAHVKLENKPVVGGPYEVQVRSFQEEVVVTRRESWYMHDGKQVRAKPYFKTVRIRMIPDPNTALLALKKGSTDETALTTEQWTSQTNDDDFYKLNTKATGMEWTYFYFGWNLDNDKAPFFKDVKVRKAMSYAFNHEEMLRKLLFGVCDPAAGMFRGSSWMSPKPPLIPYQQNLDKAEQLLDEAGWTDHDGDGIRDYVIDGKVVPFDFTILVANASTTGIQICELLKENLDQIGIRCEVRPLEYTVLQDREIKHDFQAMFGGWGTGTDPDTSENIWGTNQPRNFVQYSNKDVDILYEAGRLETDREKREQIYAKIDELIYADQPYTFLYFRNSFFGFSKELRGYKFSPRGPFGYSPGVYSIWRVLPE